jgi:hypothetical protein
MTKLVSTRPLRCSTCGRDFVYERCAPFGEGQEGTYGVAWRCPEGHGLSLDVCPVGPLIPARELCLNCGVRFASQRGSAIGNRLTRGLSRVRGQEATGGARDACRRVGSCHSIEAPASPWQRWQGCPELSANGYQTRACARDHLCHRPASRVAKVGGAGKGGPSGRQVIIRWPNPVLCCQESPVRLNSAAFPDRCAPPRPGCRL